MQKLAQLASAIAACCLLISCASYHQQLDLAKHFEQMHVAGRLPGLPAEVHDRFRTEGTAIGSHTIFPFSQKVFVTRDDNPTTYTYAFTKDTKDSEWRLVQAWSTSGDGKNTELKVE